MNTLIPNIDISFVSCALPENRLDLLSLASLYGEAEIKRIISSTGISQVAVAKPLQTASDLCVSAAENIFNHGAVLKKDIDAIIFVSQTPDKRLPATSVLLQKRLSLPSHITAFDINYGCSGYIYGLFQAALLIHARAAKRVLICAGDTITHHINPSDRAVRLVFGDAGSATIVEKGVNTLSFSIHTDGSGADSLYADFGGYLYMDGKAVMEFALDKVPRCVNEVMGMTNWKKEEIGSFVFHQANQFMLNYLRKKMGLDKKSVPVSMQSIGNTGPASIPCALLLEKKFLQTENRLEKSILCGFGVGFSYGAVGVNLSQTTLLPFINNKITI